jgi:hypothetical protein
MGLKVFAAVLALAKPTTENENLQPSTFNLQPSTFNRQLSIYSK